MAAPDQSDGEVRDGPRSPDEGNAPRSQRKSTPERISSFRGLIAFPITPMDAQGRVDTEAFRKLICRLVEAEVDALCVLGSTGSYPYLERDERRRAVDAAMSEVDGRAPVMAGIGALRTDAALRLAEDARAAGVQGGLLAPVSYTPLLEDEVYGLFEAVAAQVDLPLVIYDNPGTTHFSFSNELIARLARLSNVKAVKTRAPEPAGAPDTVQTLRALLPQGFSIGFSTDWNAVDALIAGGDAWYSVVAGLFPGPCMDIRRAIGVGDFETARRLNARMAPLWDLARRFTGLRTAYAAANLIGLTRAVPPLPIRPLGPEALREVAQVLRTLSLY